MKNSRKIHRSKSLTGGDQSSKLQKIDHIKHDLFQKSLGDLRGKVIEVEGNIGSGKTTLSKLLMNSFNSNSKSECNMFSEKVHDVFLGAFYENPKRYAFAFQMYMLTTRLYQIDEGHRQAREEKKLVLLDRGAVGDTLFALTNYSLGSMDAQDFKIYQSVCKERLPSTLSSKVDMVVYLDVEPSECHRRMNLLRKRESEAGVPLSYLEEVDSCYFHLFVDWLAQRRGTFYDMNIGPPPPILIIRWSNFGKIEDVITRFQQLLNGERSSPVVKFQSVAPKTELTIDTKEEMQVAYRSLVNPESKGTISSPVTDNLISQSSSQQMNISVSPVVAINWSLKHDNDFKRVVMYYLSLDATIIFYGPGSISD